MKDMLKKGFITIFSKPYCPYCKKAKEFCEEQKLPFNVIDPFEQDFSSEQLEELRKLGNGQKTYPYIFAGTRIIGGFSDIKGLYDKKKLDEVLAGEGIARA